MFVYENTTYTNCVRGTEGIPGQEPMSCFPQAVGELHQYMMPFDSPFCPGPPSGALQRPYVAFSTTPQ
jgi:hypothetical protein